MRDQILALFAQGASQEEVIKITGASTALIGELLGDKIFLQELRDKRETVRQELIDQGYAKLEQKTINSLAKDVEGDYVDAAAKCRILEAVAKNRVLHRNPSGHYNNPTVHLTVELKIPDQAQAQPVTIDQKTNQIIAIGERNMAGMPIQGVQQLFKQLDEEKTLTRAAERAIVEADLAEGVPKNDQANETRSVECAA